MIINHVLSKCEILSQNSILQFDHQTIVVLCSLINFKTICLSTVQQLGYI